MRSVCTTLSIILFSVVFAFCQGWTPEMQINTKAVGSPRISPDGKRVVYTISDAVMTADKSEYVSQIWLATTDGKENYQVTFSDRSSTNPKWSPDSKAIAFTSSRKDNKSNLYVLRLSGGVSGDEDDTANGLTVNLGNVMFDEPVVPEGTGERELLMLVQRTDRKHDRSDSICALHGAV